MYDSYEEPDIPEIPDTTWDGKRREDRAIPSFNLVTGFKITCLHILGAYLTDPSGFNTAFHNQTLNVDRIHIPSVTMKGEGVDKDCETRELDIRDPSKIFGFHKTISINDMFWRVMESTLYGDINTNDNGLDECLSDTKDDVIVKRLSSFMDRSEFVLARLRDLPVNHGIHFCDMQESVSLDAEEISSAADYIPLYLRKYGDTRRIMFTSSAINAPFSGLELPVFLPGRKMGRTEATYKLSWLIGSRDGVVSLFIFAGVNTTAGELGYKVLQYSVGATAKFEKIDDWRKVETLVYEVCYENIELSFSHNLIPITLSEQPIVYDKLSDSFIGSLIEKRKEQWSKTKEIDFIDYICECIRHPDLFVRDCGHESVMSEIPFITSVLFHQFGDVRDMSRSSYLDNMGIYDDEKVKYASAVYKEYTGFLTWVVVLFNFIEMYIMKDEVDTEFMMMIDNIVCSIPLTNKYFLTQGIHMIAKISREMASLPAQKDIFLRLAIMLGPDFIDKYGLDIGYTPSSDEMPTNLETFRIDLLLHMQFPAEVQTTFVIREIILMMKMYTENFNEFNLPSYTPGDVQDTFEVTEAFTNFRLRTYEQVRIFA